MIKKDEWYSLQAIHEQNLLPMLKSEYLIRKWIKAKKLKAVAVGKDKGIRYSIKGIWIITFLAKWESGDFR